MGHRVPLDEAEKEKIYLGKLQGKSLRQVAVEVNCSLPDTFLGQGWCR